MKNKITFNIKQCLTTIKNKESKLFNFLRFGIVGGINTIHYYLWYILLLSLKVPYVLSHTTAFTLSMIGSYFLNCYFTFKTKPTLKKFIKYPLTTLANYLISTFSLILLVNIFHISSLIAALIASILPIPITFIVTNNILKKPDANALGNSTSSLVLKKLFVIFFLILFAIGCHLYIIYNHKLFGRSNTDSTLQFMYFLPFTQKVFLSGEPFWSWSYGLGGDVFSQFSYYYTTSPFFYLMLLIRKLGIGTWTLSSTLKWKMLFSIFKQFLAMYFLYLLLKYEKKKTYSSLIGAIIYGGCINFIWFSLFFDFMADAYVWVPLTILGWRVYNKTGKWTLFLAGATLTVANSFYFGFVSFIFYIIFILIFSDIKGKDFVEKTYSFFNYILKYSSFAIMSLLLSAIAFIPSVLAFLKTDRFSNKQSIPIFYNSDYILQLPEKIFFYASTLGFPIVILIVFALPWKKLSLITKKKVILAGVFFLLYLTPYSGSFFNGFSYPCDRWFYLLIFSIAYAVPDWLEENDKLKSVNFCFLSIVAAIMLYFYNTKAFRGFNYKIVDLRLTNFINGTILCLGLVSILALTLKKYISKEFTKKALDYSIVLCVFTTLIVNINTYFYIVQPDMTSEMLQNSYFNNEEEKKIFKELIPSNNEFFRVIFRNLSLQNAPINYGYYGASTYNSMIDGDLHKCLKVDYNILNPYVAPSSYENFDDRLFLETTFGAKYLVKKADYYIPPSVYVLNKKTDNYSIYENKHSVGFDLWYDNTTSTEDYNKMNIAKRDALILQTAVVDQNIAGIGTKDLDNVTSEFTLAWGSLITKNAKYKDGVITAEDNASITIPINNTKTKNEGEILFSINLKPLNGEKIKLTVNEKSTTKMEENYPYVYPLNTFTFKLDGNTNVLKINISKGKFMLSNAQAWFNSYKNYDNWVKQRNKYNLENLYVNGGKVKGTIKNNEKGIIALNIPFSKGWSATVDGKKQDLIKVNGILTGLALEPGSHNIELTYITPGLIVGSLISGLSFIGIVIFYILNRKGTNSNMKSLK